MVYHILCLQHPLHKGLYGGLVAKWLVHSKDTGSNPAEASHYVTTVGKLFSPTVPSGQKAGLTSWHLVLPALYSDSANRLTVSAQAYSTFHP